MLAFAEQAEREYAAQTAAYVQTPADIVEQARAVQGEPAPEDSFSIYQLKGGDETLDYRFEPLDSIHRNGRSVDPANYELVYTAPLTERDSLESIYTRFNIDRPADFTGHSLSVSDIVVLHQGRTNTAHYCDRAGFSEVPEFLNPPQQEKPLASELREISERIQTPTYEDNVSGKLSDDRFAKMSRRYEDEQKEISEKIKTLRAEMDKLSSKSITADMFISTVRKYTRAKTLTPRMLNELIDHIEVHQAEKIDGIWEQHLVIHYNCVGAIFIPDVFPLPAPQVSVNTRKGVVVNYAPGQLVV